MVSAEVTVAFHARHSESDVAPALADTEIAAATAGLRAIEPTQCGRRPRAHATATASRSVATFKSPTGTFPQSADRH
jgi:hypothetical protein